MKKFNLTTNCGKLPEFNLSEKIEELDDERISVNAIKVEDVKEFIKQVEWDLLKKYKLASVPIMQIIKARAGDKLI
jgi:hypothetical protein